MCSTCGFSVALVLVLTVWTPCRPVADMSESGLTWTSALVQALTSGRLPRIDRLNKPSMHAVLQLHSQGTTRRLHANSGIVSFCHGGYVSSRNVTGTSSEYYNCITSAAQSDCLTSVIRPDLKRSMQMCNYNRNPGKYLRTLNIYYFKKYRIDIIGSVQQLDMHKIYQSVQ